jgi:hypothetical protein
VNFSTPSKKRWMISPSPDLGSASDQTRKPSSLRNAQEITTTRCRCSGRKSLPFFARWRWKANSATSASERAAGNSCSVRRPAMSGMVSMSKTRTGVMGWVPRKVGAGNTAIL